ncbi:amidase [Alphaproteobacteria bacterium]|nr:amidase [Rhodospirillaceae bacterium]MBT6307680.1 amidase [Rhodospirillaceae bacterium]MBT7732695.1 amidase [Rhodospirillaceae bacterium]MDC0997735.1 amidase [Alphaproteobacteria bacterium]
MGLTITDLTKKSILGYSSCLSATDSVARILSGEIKPSEIMSECIANIQRCEMNVGAWSFMNKDRPLREASELDKMKPEGSLFGIPFGVKDNIDTHDMSTGYGTSIYEGNQPSRDAACVAGLRSANAIPLGKTVCTEFAHRAPGKTANPWNLDHTPGGSSSGSAAAVASGMVPIAIGTQTTGSVIRPAAYCGVIGYKPTYGDFNVSGVLANTPSFDTLGFFSKEIEDMVLIRKALLDNSIPLLANVGLRNVKIGVATEPYWSTECDLNMSLIEQVEKLLSRAGAQIRKFDGTEAFKNLEQIGTNVSGYEFARTLSHERRCFYDQLSPILRDGRMADGFKIDYSEYIQSVQTMERSRLVLDGAMSEVDFVICPSAPSAASAGLHETGSASFNMAWTWLHTPVVTLPIALDTQTGLPLGLQMVGKRHQDDKLLAHAGAVLKYLFK